ncbi:MAG TPA: pyrroloquinoline quinone biosynthesis peptide chaperone PqqD [Rhizomicrobium sp.]|jgi:pyrroloquinoline quinone biosynthesis protein D
MSGRSEIGSASKPRLAPHRRLHFDKARAGWTIQAPERVFLLDEPGHAIVSRCTGENTLADIVDQLCAAYPDAPRDAIFTDVAALVRDFAQKGVMSL